MVLAELVGLLLGVATVYVGFKLGLAVGYERGNREGYDQAHGLGIAHEEDYAGEWP